MGNASKIEGYDQNAGSQVRYSNDGIAAIPDKLQELNGQVNGVIEGLDDKLNKVLAKQEYEYLKGYNLYVKRKEKELRDLIEELNKKNSNNTLKDEKIINLERTIFLIRDDQIRMEKQKDDMSKQIKKWQSKSNNMEQERDFLQQQVLESKRQNKLLKMAINRLQSQLKEQGQTQPAVLNLEGQSVEGQNEYVPNGDTFLTESRQPATVEIHNLKDADKVKE